MDQQWTIIDLKYTKMDQNEPKIYLDLKLDKKWTENEF